MVAEDASLAPDVWVVEFGENFDASLDQYEALLAMVCTHARTFCVVVDGVVCVCWLLSCFALGGGGWVCQIS